MADWLKFSGFAIILGQNWKVFTNKFSRGEASLLGVGEGDGVSGSFGAGVSQFDGGEFFDTFCLN